MSRRLAIPLVSLLFAGGCSSNLTQGTPETIAVQSTPAATVVVMGQALGTTPMAVPVKAVFPSSYPPEQEALYGRIILKKEGCADYMTTVSGKVLSRGIKAELECGAPKTPAAAPAQATEPPTSIPAAPVHSPSQRLRQLDDVYKQGLISDEEYRQLRQRILDTL